MAEQKVQISKEEYGKLVIEQVREIRRTARENREPLSLHEAASQARQIVNDFYVAANEGKR